MEVCKTTLELNTGIVSRTPSSIGSEMGACVCVCVCVCEGCGVCQNGQYSMLPRVPSAAR